MTDIRPFSEREEAALQRMEDEVFRRVCEHLLEKNVSALALRVAKLEQRQPPTLPASAPDSAALQAARQEAERVKRELDAVKQEARRLNDERDAAQEAAERLKGELDAALSDANAVRQDAQRVRRDMEPFKELLEVYSRYAATEAKWGAIPTETPIRFLVCGCRANAITALWEAMRERCESVGEAERGDWNAVSDALRFLLEQYNSTFDSPVWQLTDCKPGERFNDERHIRATNGNQYSGTVEKVLLQGIWDCKQKKAHRKCVVAVK